MGSRSELGTSHRFGCIKMYQDIAPFFKLYSFMKALENNRTGTRRSDSESGPAHSCPTEAAARVEPRRNTWLTTGKSYQDIAPGLRDKLPVRGIARCRLCR
jgi:hypothetical protein